MGQEFPYIIKFAIDDSDIRKSLAKIDWEEELGLDKGKIITDALKSDAKTASDAIERELGGTSINWKKILGADLFQQLETKITKQAREIRDSLKGWIDAGDMKRVSEAIDLITQLGQSFKELGGDFNAKSFFTAFEGMTEKISKFEEKVTSLEGTLKRIQTSFGVTFNDKGGIIKTSNGIERIGKALLVMGANKSAINNLKGIESELNKIGTKSTIKIKADVDEGELSKFWNEQIDALSQFDDLTIDDLIKDLDSYKDKAKELIPIISNLLAIDEKAKKRGFGSFIKEAIDYGDLGFDEFYDRKEARKAMNDIMSTLQEEVDKGSKKVSEAFEKLVSGINEIEVDLTLTQKTKDELRDSINNYVKELNEGSKIEPVKIKAIFDRIRKDNPEEDVPKIEDATKEKKNIKQKKYGDEVTLAQVQKVKSKIEKEIQQLQTERDVLQKELDKQDAAIREDKRGRKSAGQTIQKDLLAKHIEEYKQTIEAYQEIQRLMEDPQSAAEITKEWNNTGDSFTALETKQKAILAKTGIWKQEMIKALTFSSSDLDGKFEFEDAGEQLYNAINSYLSDDAHKLLVKVDAKHIADQVSGILNASGINLGGGGNVNLDTKELGNIIASVMQSVLTGAPMPTFDTAPQEQQADVMQEVTQETTDATKTTVRYVHSVTDSTIGLEHLIDTLKKLTTVANGVKFENGKNVPTASKDVRAFAEWLTGRGINILPNEKNNYQTLETMDDAEIKTMIQNALFTELKDLSAKGGTLPSDIKDWMSGRKEKGVTFKENSVVGVLQKAFKEIFVNNGVPTESSEARIKRQDAINAFVRSAMSGAAYNKLNSVRGGLYPGNDEIKRIPSADKIQEVIDFFGQLAKMTNPDAAIIQERANNLSRQIVELESSLSGAELTEQQQILTSLKEQLTPLISARDEIAKEQEDEQKKFYTDRDEGKVRELQEKKGVINKQINDLLAQINPIESWIKNNADRYVDVAKLQQELDELKQQKNPDANTKQKIDDLSSKISKAETWRRNTQDLITSKKQQLLSMQQSADIFDTTELYRLKAAREVLGDNVDAESKGKFKEVADEFWNATERVVKGLQTLNGELEARVVVAGRADPIDITSPKQGAKLLQEGIHITHAEIYNDAAKTPIDDSFIGSTQYRNSSKSKSRRIEQGILNSGGKPSYYSDKPEGFGTHKKVDILDEEVDVAEFKPETLIIEGTDADLDGEIEKAHQNIERNKAELQAVEAEIQKSTLDVKRQQTNVKRAKTTNSKFNADVQAPQIKTDSATNKLSTKIQKKDLLARIQQGELLNSGDIKYIQQIKELYPDIYKLMVGVKEHTSQYKEYMGQAVSKQIALNEMKGKVDETTYLALKKKEQPLIDELNTKKLYHQQEAKKIQDSIADTAKSEEIKLTQQIDSLKNKSKSLMTRFEREIENLYTDINNASQKLADKNSGLSRQDRNILINSLQEKVKTAELVEAQYVEFAKKVGLNTSMSLKSYGSVVRNTASPYLDPALNVAGNKKSKLSEEESKLTIKQRELAENERKKKQLEEDTAHQEQLIQKYEAQKAKQGEINVLLEKRLVIQENINELIRQNASQDEIDAERGKLAFTEQQIKAIYAELKNQTGADPVKTERKFNTTKEAIQSNFLKSIVEYDKEIKTLIAQKSAYDRKNKELDDRKSKHELAGAVIDKKAKYKEDWKKEYMKSGADVVKAETELRDSTKLAIQNLIEPIEADYQNKINNLFSNFNKNVADAMKSKGLDHTNKNIKEDFLASDNIGKYLAQTYADQKANLEDAKNSDIANIRRQEWDKYEAKLKELRTRMEDNFIKTIQAAGDVISVTFDKLDADGNITKQSYNKNVKQEILDQIKKEKDELKAKHKPSEIESKLEAAKKYRAEALQAGQFSEGVLSNPQAAKEQINLVTELLSISDKLYEKQQELKAYEDAGLNGKDKNVRNLRKEINDLTTQKTEKEREIANRDEVLARELLEKSNKTELTTEEKLANAIQKRSKLQENLARSTDILAKKQEEYNAAKGTEGAEKAWVALEKAKKIKQNRQNKLDKVDESIERLTTKSTAKIDSSTATGGAATQGGLVGAIVSAIKESLGAVDTQGVATEETLRKIYGLLGGDYQPEGGVARNKKKSEIEVASALNAKELNKAAYDQTKDIIKNITDGKSAVDAITKSVERLKQLTNENKQDTEEYIIEQRKLGTILAKSYFGMNPQGVKGTGKDGALKWEDLKANDATLKKLGVWGYNPLTSNKALETLVGGDKVAGKDDKQQKLEALDNRISTLNSKLEQILPLIEANPEAKGIAEEVKTEISKLEADRQKLMGKSQDKTDKPDKKETDTKDFKSEVKALITEINKYKTGSKEQEPLQKALHELIKEWRASGKLGEKGATGKQLASALAKHGIKNIDPKKYALTGNQLNKLFSELNTTSAKKNASVIPTTKSTHTTSQTSAGVLLGIMQNELAKDVTLQQILTEIRSGWRDNVNRGVQQIIDAETNGNKEVAALINSETGSTSGYVEGDEDSISKNKLQGLIASGSGKFDTFLHSHGDVKDPFFSKDDLNFAAQQFADGITKQVLKNGNHITMLDMSDVEDLSGLIEALKNTKQTHKALAETASKFGAKYTHTAFRTDQPKNLMKVLGLTPATTNNGGMNTTAAISSNETSDMREIPKEFMRTQNRISKYADVFKYAKNEGWLLEDGDKKFQESKKNLDELIARYEKGEDVLQKLKDAYTATAEAGAEVNKNVNANKRLYSGTNELRSAQRQHDKIEGQYGIDLELEDADSMARTYYKAYQKLIDKYEEYAKAKTLNNTKNQEDLRQEAALVQKLGKQYASAMAEREDLENKRANSGSFVDKQGKEVRMGGFKVFSDDELANKTAAMRAYAESMYGAEAANFKLDKNTMTLSGTIRENNKVVHDVAIKYNEAAQGAYAFEKAERESLSGFPSFMRGLKEKTKAIAQYIMSMTSIYRIIGEVRKGIQYIRDIDLALTELKKVTDETEETYRKFLKTASKTAAKVGSTIKEVVSSTADFARLGYTLKEAAVFAESAQILMNVSEFTDVSRATDTLISAVQAFGYSAETSMEVVDLLNMIGNNYAISTADLAQSLTKSSASLVAAGGNLAEAAALTATANKIVQDADSVGTALKTTSLRLRGTSVDILNEEGLDSEGAVTSKSKLQSKVKALSGVDILTETGEYKSTYEILSQIADVWEDINDMDQAALLELISGKRNSSVIAAILQNPKELKEAFEDANNAAGSALRENEKYLDSIQGRIDLFTNAVQTMWNNSLDSDFVKGIVDIGTTLVKVIDKIGLFKSSLIALATYSMFKHKMGPIEFFNNLASSASKGISNLEDRLKNLKNLGKATTDLSNITANFTQVQLKDKLTAQGIMDSEAQQIITKTNLGKATDKLSASTLNATLREMGYSKEKREAIIQEVFDTQATKDNTRANAENAASNVAAGAAEDKETIDTVENIAATVADTAATKANTEANMENATSNAVSGAAENMNTGSSGGWFKSLLGGAKNFAKNNQALIKMAGAAAVITLGVKVVDWLTKTTEELEEEFTELTNELDATNSELDNLESQLEDINNQIEEINSNSPLTFTDQEELNRLKAESAELQRQIDLLETLKKGQAIETNSSAIEMANAYKDVGLTTGNTTEDNIATGGKWGAIGGGVAGAAIGAAVGSSVPIVGTIIGAIIGVIAGAIVGAVGGAAVSAAEEKVTDSLDNMKAQYSKLEKEFNEARKEYQDDPNEDTKEDYEDTLEAFNAYKSEMSSYLTQLDSVYGQIKENWDEATEKQKAEVIAFEDQMDAWAIQSGGANAKSNAITRLFGDTASDDVKALKKDIEDAMNAAKVDGTDPVFDFQAAFNTDEMAEFKQRLYSIGLTVTSVERYFLDLAKAEKEAEDSYTTYDTVKEINSLSGGINALKDAFGEITEEGYISTETLVELEETFGGLGDSWNNFVDTVATGTGSIKEATEAINELVEAYLTQQLASGPMTAEEELKTIMLLQQLGIKNAKEYVDAMKKMSMAESIASNIIKDDKEEAELKEKVDSGKATDQENKRYKELQSKTKADYIKEVEKLYKVDLTQKEEELLIEKAITAEKAKQNAEAAKKQDSERKEAQDKQKELLDLAKATRDGIADDAVGIQKETKTIYDPHGNYDITRYIYNGKQYDTPKEAREAAAKDLEKKADEVVIPAEVNVEAAEEAAEAAQTALETAFDDLGLEIDIVLADPSDLVDQIQDVFDTLVDAQKEYEENGYLSVDTLQSLLELEPKYLDLLVDENGNLNLTKDSLYAVAKARIIDMGIQSQKNILEQATKLATEGSSEALKEEISVMEAASEAGTNFVDVQMAKIKALLAERVAVGELTQAEANAFIAGIEDQIEAVQVVTQSAIDNIDNSLSASGNTVAAETEDAIQKLIDYYNNRLSANQAKQEQIQNEIDLAEQMGMKAEKSYYDEKLKLMAEQEALLQQKKADLLVELNKAEEGSDQWWEIANELNDIEGELDDVTSSIVDLQDAIGEIDTYQFDEFENRLDKLNSKLETMRDLIAPNAEEDWFDDEGGFTEKGTAVIGTYLQQLEFYKQGLAQVEADMAEFGNKSYNDLTQEQRDTLTERGIHSEQEYYDWVTKLDDAQLDYLSSISDTEIAIGDMYEASIDAVEEYTRTLVESYQDYIDACKEALDAERDLYDFKKNIQKQNKDIAATERRIAALSGSTNASDIAERRKLEAQLIEQKESLDDTYYQHSKESQQSALDAEAQAYEESMNRFVENLRTSLDTALQDMDSFLAGVSASVMLNAQVVKDEYVATGVTLDDAIVKPWDAAIAAIGTYETDGLSKMNAWTTDSGFFGQFADDAKNKLTGFWSDGIKASNGFKTSIDSTLTQISTNISTNVAKWREDISSVYADIQDSDDVQPAKSGQGEVGSNKKYYYTSSIEDLNLTASANNVNQVKAKEEAELKLKRLYEQYQIGRGMEQEQYDKLWRQNWSKKVKTEYQYYAKGTFGTKQDQWAITDELGDELVLVPGANGNLSFMRKGTSVVPADITANLVEWGKLNPDMLKIGSGANINMISNAVNKPELNFAFDSLVHVDNCSQETLKDLEKMVDNKINDFSKKLNYSIKRFTR